MKRITFITSLLLLAAATTASAARTDASGALQVQATFAVQTAAVSCPNGTPQSELCYQRTGHADIPGLGSVTETYPLTAGDEDQYACIPLSEGPVTLTVQGKGEIDGTFAYPEDCNVPHGTAATFTITGGTGTYAGASGTGTFVNDIAADEDNTFDEDDPFRSPTDTWSISLDVSGLNFDLTAPVIHGAASKTVKVAKKAKFAAVKFAVTAQDAVDGSVPVACTPRSGGHFKVGRTKVTCTATDSSANTAKATFTVTVKRRAR